MPVLQREGCGACGPGVASPAAGADRGAAPSQAAEGPTEEPYQQDALMGVMAALMPWVLSLFLHAGIMVILAFLTILSYSTKVAEGVTVPDANLSKRLGSKLNPARRQSKLQTKLMARTARSWAKRNETLSTDQGRTKDPVPLHGLEGGSGGGDAGDFGMQTGAGGAPAAASWEREAMPITSCWSSIAAGRWWAIPSTASGGR